MASYQTTHESWNKVAVLYQATFMDGELYNDSYDAFCRLVEKRDPEIFEIGCGPGNITRYLLSQRPDFRIEAIDVAPAMIELARQNVPDASFGVMDCREIESIGKQYDGMVCGFCVPYLSAGDCRKLVSDCAAMLRGDGIFYVSAIEGDYDRSGYEKGSSGDKMFVYYYDEAFLSRELRKNGLEVIEIIRKEVRKKDGLASAHLILIAQKS